MPRQRLQELAAPRLAKPDILRFVAGIRPTRKGGVRIEREQIGDKTVVHNYGHGGWGITVSWGTAERAASLVASVESAPAEIAVLGAGAVGLATARVLQEQGYRVAVFAKDFHPHTTSDLAGACWHPGTLIRQATGKNKSLMRTMLKRSWARFEKLAGDTWGVARRDLYEHYVTPRVDADDGMPLAYERVAPFPFPGGERFGQKTTTFLIEPPIYMAELQRQVLLAGGRLQRKVFDGAQDLAALPQSTIVDCMGFGARAVFGDDRVIPVRGQLVHLFPERLPYLLTGAHGYVFPRADAVVLGGTFEEGEDDPTPDDGMCRHIIRRHRRFFGI